MDACGLAEDVAAAVLWSAAAERSELANEAATPLWNGAERRGVGGTSQSRNARLWEEPPTSLRSCQSGVAATLCRRTPNALRRRR